MTDARIGRGFLEVAATGTSVASRIGGALLEVAVSRFASGAATVDTTAAITSTAGLAGTGDASVAATATVDATALVAQLANVTVPITASVVATPTPTFAAASTTFTAGTTAAATRVVTPDSTVATAASTTSSASQGATGAVTAPLTASTTAAAGIASDVAATRTVTAAVTATASATTPVATISAVELQGNIASVTVAGIVEPPPPTPEGTAGIQVSLVSTNLAVSPGSLIVKIANGTPGATVTLHVENNLVPDTTVVLDESGAAAGVNVPVSVASTGSQTLTVTEMP